MNFGLMRCAAGMQRLAMSGACGAFKRNRKVIGSTTSTAVGINPFSIAYNYQTGTMFTINAGTTPPVDGTVLTQNAGSSSVVDTQTSKTRATLSISSQSQFAAAMENLTNTAVVVDQNNNRLLMIPMPK